MYSSQIKITLAHAYSYSQFDLCDPERHFALVVPQRAKNCPALLNAIYTASARYLSRLERYRNNGMVEYNGNPLPNLNMETAAEYHSKCTEHLVSVSDNLDVLYDENLLVASVILRFYEEIDGLRFPSNEVNLLWLTVYFL